MSDTSLTSLVSLIVTLFSSLLDYSRSLLYIPAYSTFLYPPTLSIYFFKSLYRDIGGLGLAFWLHHQTFVHEFGSTHWTAHSSPKHNIPIHTYILCQKVYVTHERHHGSWEVTNNSHGVLPKGKEPLSDLAREQL